MSELPAAPKAPTVLVSDIRRGLYLDSVALMRMARSVAAMAGVIECGMMMGTPANLRIMADAGVLADAGVAAAPGDLVIAIAAHDRASADAALGAAQGLLRKPKGAAGQAARWAPRSIRAAVAADPAANLALISVSGAFAAAEGRKALQRGLHVLMFSDNVAVADELALKQLARDRGLLIMGPDCGTAIINGTPLGFANAVPRGSIGIIGASGTGIQEVSCLLANNGSGISQAIGTGGRDLKADVGGITTLMAFDLLDADPATAQIVIISKPPAAAVAAKILARVAASKKPVTVCFLGAGDLPLPANAKQARTLKDAAQCALGTRLADHRETVRTHAPLRGRFIRGLFCGGTLCSEAQIVLQDAGFSPISNVPVPGAEPLTPGRRGHVLIDLGDDAYTQGRPHPMIDPAVRDDALARAFADADVAVILFDLVLGTGAHVDPASYLCAAYATARARTGRMPLLIGSITGTSADAQNLRDQKAQLAAIAIVCPSNADAAAEAVRSLSAAATD